MIKRFLTFCLICCLASLVFCVSHACAAETDDRLSIVASNFPAFDFARVLASETADVQLLLPPGSESHSYEPTPQDIIAIQNADLFVYTGGESDHWMEEILLSIGENAPEAFRMADCVLLLHSETAASMDGEHTHTDTCGHEHDHAHEMDEHVWTSPKNVMLIAQALSDRLSALNPTEAEYYAAANASYQEELQALDDTFSTIVQTGRRDLIIFGDRFPMRYFAAAYGLHYDAAFPGCSEDSEPSVRTVISLVDTIREMQIPVVFYIEFSSRRTADILAEETGAKPLLFHSCHNVSAEEIQSGASYLTLMYQNAEVLKEALN